MKNNIVKIEALTKVNTLSKQEQLVLKGGTEIRTGRIKISRTTAHN